jgi:hypothetical protein
VILKKQHSLDLDARMEKGTEKGKYLQLVCFIIYERKFEINCSTCLDNFSLCLHFTPIVQYNFFATNTPNEVSCNINLWRQSDREQRPESRLVNRNLFFCFKYLYLLFFFMKFAEIW